MNIKELYEQNKGSVKRVQSRTYPELYVLKYTRSVFFDNTWNDFLRECRGMVIDENWNLVSLPFRKIHNYKIEVGAPEFHPSEVISAIRKVNGFMVAVTWYKDDLLWSTTGSLDSDFVGYAKETFAKLTEAEQKAFRLAVSTLHNHTFMFECVHSVDPHIVHEEPGLYYIGSRLKGLDKPDYYDHSVFYGTGIKKVEEFLTTIVDLESHLKTVSHEGFVIRSLDVINTRVTKIKSPHYLAKKFLMRGNWKKFLNAQPNQEMPEEFIKLRKWILEVDREGFFELDELARREYIEKWFSDQYNA